jgi:hypothetical protein
MAQSAVFPTLRFRPEFGITPGLSATLPLGFLQDRRSLENDGWFRVKLGLDCEWLFANCVRAVLFAKLVRH